jgi:hypothetical protein
MGNEVRYFEGEEVEEVHIPLFEVRVVPHGRDLHFHGPVEDVLVETCGFMGSAADDHQVDGGAAAPTSVVCSTMGMGGMLTGIGSRRTTIELRVTLHSKGQAAWVRKATTRGDVVRVVFRDEGFVGGRRVSEKRVSWRWW